MNMLNHKQLRGLLVGAGLLASSAAMALIEAPPPAPPANGVSVGWMVFVPAELTVKPGTTVTWTNWDDSNHGISFPDQKGPRMNKGDTFTRTFATAGEYPYQCTFHGSRMTGKIIVK